MEETLIIGTAILVTAAVCILLAARVLGTIVAGQEAAAARDAQLLEAVRLLNPTDVDDDPLERQEVILNTKDGQSIRGVLLHRRPDRYTLVKAAYLREGAQDVPIDGRVSVDTENVAWTQIPPRL